jgi:arylsulfatase A-like enzyme
MYRDNRPTLEDKGAYATDLFKREALRFLREHENRPWFLYLPFNAPHGSSSLEPKIRGTVQAPEEFKKLYPVPKTEFEEKTNKRTGKTELKATDEARKRDYRAAVTCMDAAIGEVLDYLDKTGQARETLVIFHSDNGGSGGADNSPLRGHKGQMFEGGLRVPCVIRWPARIPAGRVCDDFLTTLEILPTILAATGVNAPSALKLDGFDMLPCLRGEAKPPREQMFWQRQADSAARWRDFKWIRSAGKESLFDLSADVTEKEDLAKSNPEMLRQMRERFEGWRGEMDAAEPRGPFRNF